ncbi:hypothetical protein [Aeoliella sp.]|uniref:hypothetical protein n=1 Tax=Aeoliella sp. TaxID=2795800 RepID=UPI003CCC2F3C
MTEQQANDFVSVVSTGCPVDTGLDVTGVSAEEYDEITRADGELARRARRAAGLAEFHQLRNIKEAGTDPKNWRASVWWLERCRGDRYLSKPPRTFTQQQVEAFHSDVAQLIDSQVRHQDDHERVLEKLSELADEHLDTASTTPGTDSITTPDE